MLLAMAMSVDSSRRRSPSVWTGARAFWVSLPLSLLVHGAVLTGLLIWLAQDRVGRVEPASLTVTLLAAGVPGDTLDPTTNPAPVPAGATAEPIETEHPNGRPERTKPTVATTEQPEGSTRPPPERAPAAELASAPSGLRPAARSPAVQDTIPPSSSKPEDADRHAMTSPQSAPLPPGNASISPPTEIQAQIVAVESAYLAGVRRAVEAARYYPRRARRMGHQGTVALRFEILSDGRIRQARVQKSSGSRTLDAAALNILKRVGRFAPLPEALDRLSLAIRLPVDYHLD
jgi:protein TonB